MEESKRAYELIEQGNYEEAKEILIKTVSENPTPADLFNLALCLYKLGELDEALEILDRLLETDPEHRKGLFLKAVVLRQTARLEEAKEFFEKAGAVELAESIPTPVKKPEQPEEQQPEAAEEIPDLSELDELKEKIESIKDIALKFDVIRIIIEGNFKVDKKFFVAFLTKDGSLEETNGLISGTGSGELIIANHAIPEGDIRQDTGEGQLTVELEDETFALKVNPDEKIFYHAVFNIRWAKT